MSPRVLQAALLVVGLGALGGCSSDYSVEFGYVSTPPIEADVSVEFDQIRLQDGYAVAVRARPFRNRDKMDWETTLELEASDPRIVGIERLEFDIERQERKDEDFRDGDWGFMLWGASVGSATIDVWIDGELEAEIPVFVNPQP